VAPDWATFAEALPQARDTVAAKPEDIWGPRLFVTADPPELVGWGGFKGALSEGTVELGYEIAACRRERGLATAAVRAMVAEAFDDPEVTTVIAHTLPERNASNCVLEARLPLHGSDLRGRAGGMAVFAEISDVRTFWIRSAS
jgi:ribosomal-protein-alanine N-acetyltransferase